MSPGSEAEESGKEKAAPGLDRDYDQTNVSLARTAAKRRTKSGCMTCRKRRIKCGEEKPFCKNCIKSKRECAGYSQPLVYKQHNQSGRPMPRETVEGHSLSSHEHFAFNEAIDPALSHGRGPLEYFHPHGSYPHHAIVPGGHDPISMSYSQPYPTSATEHRYTAATPISFEEQQRRHSMQDHSPQFFAYGGMQYAGSLLRQGSGWGGREQSLNGSESSMQHYPEVSPASQMTSPFESYTPASAGYFPPHGGFSHVNIPRRYSTHGFVQASPHATAIPILTDSRVSLDSARSDFEDLEDPWDVDMDDHEAVARSEHQVVQGLNDILERKDTSYPGSVGASRALQVAYHPFNMSPLSEERNQRVFRHFVEVTGRCMSIFERSPNRPELRPPRTTWGFTLPAAAMTNPALAHAILALAGLHVAKLRDTSEEPALKHNAYALRRINKLLGLPKRRHEIATLATVLLLGFYEVMSAEHSRWNLHLDGAKNLIMEHDFASKIRVVRRMRHGAKQRINQFAQQHGTAEINYFQVAGIPQDLLDDEEWEIDQDILSTLTGFTIDYDKHLQPGSSVDNVEVDLNERDVTDLKTRADLRWWYHKQDVYQSMVSGDPLLLSWSWWKYCPPRGRIGNSKIPFATFDHLLLLLGRLTNFGGRDRQRKIRVIASQDGHWKPQPGSVASGQPPSRGLPNNQHVSATSARPIIHEHSYPVQQKSPTEKSSPPAPSANEKRVRQSKSSTEGPSFQGGPPMYGMMPPPSSTPIKHSAFRTMENTIRDKVFALPQLEVKTDLPGPSLEDETLQAVQEHIAIAKAFTAFVSALGSDFKALPETDSQQLASPFGPPLRFRSPTIACVWLLFNVGKILLHRLHPSMPPAAMVAAGITAKQTNEYAQNIGKICAGLYLSTPSNPDEPLDPGFAGSLVESTFFLLFAAVQYQDLSQRGWTIAKFHDIARMTGWQTSAAVAAACETAWEKQGLAGRGPPYQRSLDRNNKDVRVNGTSRLLDPDLAVVEAVDATSKHESQFVRHDRNLIGKHGSTRVHWALGLLSVEKDIERLKLNET